MGRIHRQLACGLAGLVVGSGLAWAYSSWNQSGVLTVGETYDVQYLADSDTSQGVENHLVVMRTPIDVPTNTFVVTATLTIGEVGVLESCSFDVAIDLNLNGILEESEWTALAAATVVELEGQTIATIAPTPVNATGDGYRVSQRRVGMQPMADIVSAPGLEIEGLVVQD
jgi:hypothetical protein